MFIHRNNPIVETDFANVEIHIGYNGSEGYSVTIIYQDDRTVESYYSMRTMKDAWSFAYSVMRSECKDHPTKIIAIVY